jgi:hypothetical protein
MMREPPAEPTTATGDPSAPKTMVGDMDDRGRLPGATAFATGRPPISGRKEKSVSWLFSTIPPATVRAPNTSSTVVVSETTLPVPSTMERWLVPFSGCGGWLAGGADGRCQGGLPGRNGARGAVPVQQLRAREQVDRVEQPAHRHRHHVGVGEEAVAVGEGEAARFPEQERRVQRLRRPCPARRGPSAGMSWWDRKAGSARWRRRRTRRREAAHGEHPVRRAQRVAAPAR